MVYFAEQESQSLLVTIKLTFYSISRATLWAVENGSATVAMGTYVQVLFVLGLAADLLQVAGDDVLGRKLQDAALTVKKRVPKRKGKPNENCLKRTIY